MLIFIKNKTWFWSCERCRWGNSYLKRLQTKSGENNFQENKFLVHCGGNTIFYKRVNFSQWTLPTPRMGSILACIFSFLSEVKHTAHTPGGCTLCWPGGSAHVFSRELGLGLFGYWKTDQFSLPTPTTYVHSCSATVYWTLPRACTDLGTRQKGPGDLTF